ncbi:MAG: hypothetical protein PWP65_1843 [Clostridia bacterium]|nr:hypothetical protein [Clostridia bacterium]
MRTLARPKNRYICQECGFESWRWMGRCPGCDSWNSLVEEPAASFAPIGAGDKKRAIPLPLTEAHCLESARLKTGLEEWDRVLGGGLVPGSLILLGGAPGIGKSTLLLQVAKALGQKTGKVLYVSGEESCGQTRMRAERLGCVLPSIYILAETSVEAILAAAVELQPVAVIIDSIQTVSLEEVQAAPGSVSQVRESASRFLRLAKDNGIAVVLIGHVTKDGFLAGPKVLEHLVDCVLYLEGERHQSYRLLRAFKNRFGSTNEVGLFQMGGKGLEEVLNPSEWLLAERPAGVSGSVVVSSLEGTRPLLLEIQALASRTAFGNPRRLAAGMDFNRLLLLVAVLEKRAGLPLGSYDIYLNVVGGVEISEPAADLGICLAVASSLKDVPVGDRTMVLGEVGLAGEVRGVTQPERRIEEAARLGFTSFIVPETNKRYLQKNLPDLDIIGVSTLAEALKIIFRPH